MRTNKLLLLSLILLIAIFAIGCTAQPNNRTQTRIGVDRENLGLRRDNNRLNRNRMSNNIRNIDRNNDLNDNNDMIGMDMDNNRLGGNNNILNNDNNNSRLADRIAKEIERLNNVDEASVLLSGNTAIVGVDMDDDVEGQITSDLKQRIAKIVKNRNKDIENVSITADPDLFTRISNMAEDITNGRPISGFADQFEEILRRITPIR
ncbi:MAG: YhcN/YlaJ family sporulation lipoprotein [Tissierellia bacterium]|nr:YhcN/YlaJ family sporulation lipoprotein [Tissierellia bacterium]